MDAFKHGIEAGEEELALLRAQMLAQLDKLWRSGMETHMEELKAVFRALCLRISEQQTRGEKGPIGYIHFSYLRSWLMQGELKYALEAYDDTWYMDRCECIELYACDWLYPYLERMEEGAKAARPYTPNGAAFDSRTVRLREIVTLHQYVREWLRRALPQLLALPEFAAVKRAEILRIRTGEYKDFSEQLWMEDLADKDAKAVQEWLEQKHPTAYIACDLRSLDLSGGNYADIDLRYSHCTSGNWSNAKMERSICIGTDFSGSKLSGTNLSQSLLFDADFSSCKLGGASFREAAGGRQVVQDGMVLGFRGINFRAADLEGADLLYADFDNADFSGACMNGALVMSSDAHKWQLSEDQKRNIQWMVEDESGVPVPADA